MNYADIKNNIKPFDIIFFRNTSLASYLIQFVEFMTVDDYKWSHVGVVINTDFFPIKNGIKDELYILESTMSGKLNDGLNECENNTAKLGVQVRKLDDLVRIYNNNGQIAWGQLNYDKDLYNDDIKNKCIEFYNDHINDIYEICINNLFYSCLNTNTKINMNWLNTKTEHALFCSELITKLYKKIGILNDTINDESIAPTEFYTMNIVKDPIRITYDA